MKKIILDTNFIMAISQFKIDIFAEIDRICHFPYKLYILDKTLEELIKLEKQRKTRQHVNIALKLIKNINIIKTNSNESVDTLLKKQPQDVIIATQDRELKKSLKNHVLIVIRQKKYLQIKNQNLY